MKVNTKIKSSEEKGERKRKREMKGGGGEL